MPSESPDYLLGRSSFFQAAYTTIKVYEKSEIMRRAISRLNTSNLHFSVEDLSQSERTNRSFLFPLPWLCD